MFRFEFSMLDKLVKSFCFSPGSATLHLRVPCLSGQPVVYCPQVTGKKRKSAKKSLKNLQDDVSAKEFTKAVIKDAALCTISEKIHPIFNLSKRFRKL